MAVDNEQIDKLERLTPFKFTYIEPRAEFLSSDNVYVYYIDYHGREAQMYRYLFSQYAELL